MKLNNFYVVRYDENGKSTHSVCYYEPDADVNSSEFKNELGFSEDTLLHKVPEEEWSVSEIKDVMDAFFDDSCKSGTYYESSNFERILTDAGLDTMTQRKVMLGILKAIEQQFGY